jgi:hypothetical protein
LLHLKGAPRTEWDVLDCATRLYLPPQNAAKVLHELAAKGLAVVTDEPPRYRYQPSSAELADFVEKLADMDRTQPVTLINLIYAQAKDIQALADAFKLRNEKGAP